MACHVRKAKSVLPGELHRFLYDSQFRDYYYYLFFLHAGIQPDCGSLAGLREAYEPNYGTPPPCAGKKPVGLRPSVKIPTRSSDRPAPGESIRAQPRIVLRSLAAELVLQLQHHDSWDSSQTPHVTTRTVMQAAGSLLKLWPDTNREEVNGLL